MKTIDTATIKTAIDLIELVGRYTELRRVTATEYHGPCPWCGGDDRFRVTAERFACRRCERSGDAIAFVMQRQNVDFKEAVSILQGNALVAPVTRRSPVAKAGQAAAPWNAERAAQAVDDAHLTLMAGATDDAWAALGYLRGRGFETATLKAFQVGCCRQGLPRTWNDGAWVYPQQLAITLPWIDGAGVTVAIKYRFVEAHTYTDIDQKIHKGIRFTNRGQASGRAFGWNALQGPGRCRVLVICEGEMNALSLWQAGAARIDVLSLGSQVTVNHLPADVIDLAQRYAYSVVWADERDVADSAAQQIRAASMRSPGGRDANDLLKAGLLSDLLGALLERIGVEGV